MNGNGKINLAFRDLSEVPTDILQANGQDMKELDLTDNNIHKELRFLLETPNLETLILDHNLIPSHVKIPASSSLQTLWLNHNKISNLGLFITTLSKSCPNLTFLCLMNNEAAPSYFNGGSFLQYKDYRYYVISKFPSLLTLDDSSVTKEERAEAERIYGKTLTDEEILRAKIKRAKRRSSSLSQKAGK